MVKFWTPAEARIFLATSSSHRLYALFYLALMTGMRAGELLGLRWVDFDARGSVVRIEQNAVEVGNQMLIGTPKTKASRRRITISPDTVEQLEAHRERQRREIDNAAEGYQDHGLVFASEIGTVTNYHNLRKLFKNLIARAVIKGWQAAGLIGEQQLFTAPEMARLLEQPELAKRRVLSDLNLHGLRHTHASVLIRRGVNAKVVSQRLGHTNVSFTLTVYGHLYEDQLREAAIGMEDFLGPIEDQEND